MSLLTQASLIVTPNAYKEGTLYSVIPSDGSGDLSVTRATTATRVNSAGLVELVPYNLVSYSEDFANAAWTKINATITANAITAPDGTLTADKFESTAAAVSQLSQSITSSNTISIYAKAGNIDILNIWIGSVVTFNLTSGTVTAGTATMENAGNGWWRCIITTNSGAFNPYIIASASGQFVYVWGAQAVQGTNALTYQKTETRLNIPRLDYSNGTCPSILVEPQRTNLALWSSSFDNAYWAKENATITANSVISPDGTQNADTLTDDAVNGRHRFQTYFTGTAGTSYTLSIYVKKNSANRFLLLNAQSIIGQKSVLNLDTLEITNLNGASGQVVDAGNGWYRFSVSGTYITASNYYIQMQNSASDVSYVGNGSSFYLWGAQLEIGSYSTSYIPTTSASVTRNADVISKTGISSLIGQTEGTLFVDFNISEIDPNPDYAQVANLSNNALDNRLGFARLPNGGIHIYVVAGGVGQFTYNTTQTIGEFKLAITYKLNDYAIYLNGTNIYTNNSASVPNSLSRFDLGNLLGSYQTKVRTNATALWKTRLTNDELERLTGVGFNTYTEMANYYNYITQ